MRDVCSAAVDAAIGAGAEYADARVVAKRNQFVATKNGRVERLADSESEGIGVRVLVNGAWGFACDRRLSAEGARDAALRACTFARAAAGGIRGAARAGRARERQRTARRSSATRSRSRSTRRSRTASRRRRRWPGPDVVVRQAMVRAQREHKLLAHVRGHRGRAGARSSAAPGSNAPPPATASSRCAAIRARTSARAARCGWEYVDGLDLSGEAPRVAEQAAALRARRRVPERRDDGRPRRRPGCAAGARVGRPPDRARPRATAPRPRTPGRAS